MALSVHKILLQLRVTLVARRIDEQIELKLWLN